jgi:hypothetical protein
LDEPPRSRHSESLSVEVSFDDTEFRQSVVELRHRTTLEIGANGSVAAFGAIGWEADPAQYADGVLHVLRLLIGIEGRLTW